MTSEPKRTQLLRSTVIVGSCTMLSRVLGFAREILMARMFGTTLVQSAFTIAFLIPNLFRRVLGEGAFSAAFIPVYTEVMDKKGKDAADKLAGSVFTMLGLALLLIVVAGITLISIAISSIPLGEEAQLTLPLMRIMLPYAFFICLVAGVVAILNSMGRFAVPAMSPVLLNIVWIFTLVFICPMFGDALVDRIYGVAWGVLAAGGIQLLFQMPLLIKVAFKARVSFNWRTPEVRKVLLLMGPAAIAMGVFQFNFLIDRLLALYVAEWAPAALQFSERLIYLPLGIFATALGTVLLPTFSRQATQSKDKELLETLSISLKSVMIVMIPASVGIFVLARPLVELVFEGGSFTSESTTVTVRALLFYSPGLLVFSLHKIFVPAFYALKDTVTPVKIGLRVVGLNLGLNILFILTWPEGYKHAGLAFATVLASVFNSLFLGILLTRRVGSPGWFSIFSTALRCIICAAVMGVVVFFTGQYLSEWLIGLGLKSTLVLVIAVGAGVVCGLCVYVPLALILCKSDFRLMLQSLRSSPKNN